jgi:hypothetical protein
MGTKQGSHLSPLLFGWVVEQLHTLLVSETALDPDSCVGDSRAPDLLYADDTALIAGITTPVGTVDARIPQRYLDLLSSFCSIFGMKVNVRKTQFLEFLPQGCDPSPDLTLTYRGAPIPRVTQKVYMGLLWDSHRPLYLSHRDTIAAAGNRALHGMLARCTTLRITRPSFLSRLFKLLVRSAFCHGCQVWGVATFQSTSDPTCLLGSEVTNRGEHIQLQFLRHLAGVGSSVKRILLLYEFGHYPLMHHYLKLAARFWNATLDAPESSLVRKALLSDLDLAASGCRSCWSFYFLRALHSLGLCHFGPAGGSAAGVGFRIDIQALVQVLQSCTFAALARVSVPRCPRVCSSSEVYLMTYRFWIGMLPDKLAPYLDLPLPSEERWSLIRLRLSCSPLAVNTGRFRGVSRLDRVCPVCATSPPFAVAHPFYPVGASPPCEDILHFLLECPLYDRLRSDPMFRSLFSSLPSPPAILPSPSFSLSSLFATPSQGLFARCVHRMFALRELLLSGQVVWGCPHPLLPPPGHHFLFTWPSATGVAPP